MNHDFTGLNNYNKNFIDSLFDGSELIDLGITKIYKTVIPDLLWLEIEEMLTDAKKIKYHPLSKLRTHYNEGKNSFQVSVNKFLFEKSFVYPYIILCGQKYISMMDNVDYHTLHRNVLIRKYDNHYDGYDFWFNFSNKGDINPQHMHSGSISSVVYLENSENISTDFLNSPNGEKIFRYFGKAKEMILFPSFLWHLVEENNSNKERITASYNLIYDPRNNPLNT
jgi:hypothetical protein